MKCEKQTLIVEEIQGTIQRLHLRISDRFPGCDLANVCRGLYEISRETHATVQWIGKPNYLLRLIVFPVIALTLLVVAHSISILDVHADGINIAELVQMLGSALDGLVIVGAGVLFLVTLETRRKRRRVILAINRLRCVAHIIDMHQLTKDPDTILKMSVPTPNSPQRTLSEYELGRYLDYCTEMLSLVSKTGFLYVQDFHDPIATEAVNDLEQLANGLSSKIWQKIMVIHPGGQATAPRSEPPAE